MNRKMSRRALGWLVLAGALFATTVTGCAKKQLPLEDGQCHEWREWVPPQQVDGEWRHGYCRDAN